MKTAILSFLTLIILFSCKNENIPEPIKPECIYIAEYQYLEPLNCQDSICVTILSINKYELNYIHIKNTPLLESIIKKQSSSYDENYNIIEDASTYTDTLIFNYYNSQNQLIKENHYGTISTFTYNDDGNVVTCEVHNQGQFENTHIDYQYTNGKLTTVIIDNYGEIELFYENNSLRPTKIIRRDAHQTYYRTYDSNNNLIEERYLSSDTIDDKELAKINFGYEFIPNSTADINFQEIFLTDKKNNLERLRFLSSDQITLLRIPFLDSYSNTNWVVVNPNSYSITSLHTKVNDKGYLEGNEEGAKITYLCE